MTITVTKGELKKFKESGTTMPLALYVEKLRGAVVLDAEPKAKSRRDVLKEALTDKGVEFKGNMKTDDMEKLLEENE